MNAITLFKNDEVEKKNMYDFESIKKESDTFLTQFEQLIHLQKYDKLCVINNILVIQKISPWRYFVRKYKNQNRLSLSSYLNSQINLYSNFLTNLIELYQNNKDNDLYNILVKHYEFIKLSIPTIIYLRNRYNLKRNAQQISTSLETWYYKLTKFYTIYLNMIFDIKQR